MLELLHEASGLDSIYLTEVDSSKGEQRILFAKNSHRMAIPEGMTVPWDETLCKRALDQATTFAADVATRWKDCAAAQSLGIQTYTSFPINDGEGLLLGTLCGVSDESRELPPNFQKLLKLVAQLIGKQLVNERLMRRLCAVNAQLAAAATIDPLTGLANRRLLMSELQRLLAQARRAGSSVLVAMIDMDGFKKINDECGHATGDLLIQAIGQSLKCQLRETDLLARIGGDEFVVVGPGPSSGVTTDSALAAIAQRLTEATKKTFDLNGTFLCYEGASVGVVVVDPAASDPDAALRAADAMMYQAKRRRASLR